MRLREVAADIVIGLLLVSIFVVPIVAIGAVGGLLLKVLAHYVSRLGIADDLAFLAAICLISIAGVIRYLRKRLWLNAFISLAVIAVPAANWYRSGHWLDSPVAPTWAFLLLMIPADRSLRRWEYMLAGTVVAAGIVLNLGLLGNGMMARVVAGCAYFGIVSWIVVQWRSGEFGRVRPDALAQPNL